MCIKVASFPNPQGANSSGTMVATFVTKIYSRTPMVSTKVTSSVYHSSTHFWSRVSKVIKEYSRWRLWLKRKTCECTSHRCLFKVFSNEKCDSFYVLVIIECIDRNWFKYWALVNVTFFSAGPVLSLKCRFHGNNITDKKLQKAFVNINI